MIMMICVIFGFGRVGGGEFLAQKVYTMLKCKSVETGIQTISQRIKNEILTSNKTAIIPKIVIFKPYIVRQSVSIYILNASKI